MVNIFCNKKLHMSVFCDSHFKYCVLPYNLFYLVAFKCGDVSVNFISLFLWPLRYIQIKSPLQKLENAMQKIFLSSFFYEKCDDPYPFNLVLFSKNFFLSLLLSFFFYNVFNQIWSFIHRIPAKVICLWKLNKDSRG